MRSAHYVRYLGFSFNNKEKQTKQKTRQTGKQTKQYLTKHLYIAIYE